MKHSCRLHRNVSWFFQAVAALILLQTLFFKFTGAPESKYIFEKLGVEPWGRVGTGMAELVAAILLLWPRYAVIGATFSAALMCGAIGSHLTKLGIIVLGDHGLLFALAVTVFGASIIVVWLRRHELPVFGPQISGASCTSSPAATGSGKDHVS